MSEPKVIELTEDFVAMLTSKGLIALGAEGAKALSEGQDVLLKAPQPKLVHLSELPDGTKIGVGAYVGWMHNGEFWLRKTANEYYEGSKGVHDKELRLKQGEWQVWQGGECPWPEYVEVEVLYRNKTTKVIHGVKRHEDWKHVKTAYDDDIIAHRCTGRLLHGAKLVP